MNKRRAVTGRENQDLNQFINDLSINKRYEVRNYRELRNLDLNNSTLSDVANFLMTLVKDLKEVGMIRE